jgi:hypothetical protein
MVSYSFYDLNRSGFADGVRPDPQTQHTKQTTLTIILPQPLACTIQLFPPLPSQTSIYICGSRPPSGLKLFLLYCGYFAIVLLPLHVIESHAVAQPGIDVHELMRLTQWCRQITLGANPYLPTMYSAHTQWVNRGSPLV